MRILTATFVSRYAGRLMNIHPSLLPKFPGLDTHRRAIDAGEKEHGASVHFVVADLDSGPVIAQVRVPIRDGDDPESLAERVLRGEHRIYPQAIRWYAEGRLRVTGGQVLLDDRPALAQ
jgi:phosphoribosylglycinamide formyltransferase-1